ncbi:hypothetical protein [Cellulophaga baltica]|uniref:Uncharacterized protein n=1 Tax=Cellulophaga baltica TaxID=76594 RepID=A0A1G7HFB0_9FLAO|nr:hypothetical protein [Cellulophaga baltica]MCR1026412.1 hypothetical protein [Cellulophaga baltica]SDE98739.1 hypothetical protein SAMN04487992_10617 [Cellulophaga baltica]
MNFFRKLLGLGPKELVNVRPRANSSQTKRKESIVDVSDIDHRKIYPTLLSQKTKSFDLVNELVAMMHDREGLFAPIVIGHVMVDEKEVEDGGPALYQVRTSNKNEEDYKKLRLTGEINLDALEIPFIDWNYLDSKLNFQVLSCTISQFSSEKILSKKHLQEAHKKLGADELLVSIPRKGLIFVCSKNISDEDYGDFLNMHGAIVLQENEDLEFLCEDLFVVKNGEIENIIGVPQLSEMLKEKR